MEEILGAHNDDRAFDRFLSSWREVMERRIEQSRVTLGDIRGVAGLVLAGSNGIGRPWPLSDIDLIPIYVDASLAEAREHLEHARVALLKTWSSQGWRTGLDVGRLWFTLDELTTVFASGNPEPIALLSDDRWYHAIDKAFGGRALIDPDGHASQLVTWLTTHRFHPAVGATRLERSAAQVRISREAAREQITMHNRPEAFAALLKSVQWYQIHLMEGWGERDNSLGRFGTRFERSARAHEMDDICDMANSLSSLSRDLVHERLEQAPRWVHERRDRSWKARQHVGEPVTMLQNDRDVLRVCTMYELRLAVEPPYPAWLAIPMEDDLHHRIHVMDALAQNGFAG